MKTTRDIIWVISCSQFVCAAFLYPSGLLPNRVRISLALFAVFLYVGNYVLWYANAVLILIYAILIWYKKRFTIKSLFFIFINAAITAGYAVSYFAFIADIMRNLMTG